MYEIIKKLLTSRLLHLLFLFSASASLHLYVTLTREDTVNYDRTRASRMKTQRYSFYDVALEEQHETFAPMDRRRPDTSY